METQLYQVSYLGATYYAVPVYYPGSATFKSWYLIAYVDGRLTPYTVVSGGAVIVLYNAYNSYLGNPSTPLPGVPLTPAIPSPASGVLGLNGLTGNLTLVGVGGVVASQFGSTITLSIPPTATSGLNQAQADLLYVRLPNPSPGSLPSTLSDPLPQYLTYSKGDARYLQPAAAIPTIAGVLGTPAGTLLDPFPIYLTKLEGDGLYQPLGTLTTPVTPSSGLTQIQADARYIQIPVTSPGVPASTPSDPLPVYLKDSEVVPSVLVASILITAKRFLASPVSGTGPLSPRAIELADLPVIPGVTVNQNIFKVKQTGNQTLSANTYTALTNWVATHNPNSIINLVTGDFIPTASGLYSLTINGIISVTAPHSTENVIAIALYQDGIFLELFSILPMISSTVGFAGQCVFLATAAKTYSIRMSPTKNVSVLNSGGFCTNMGLIPAY